MQTTTNNVPTGVSDRSRKAYVLYVLSGLWMVIGGVGVTAGAALSASAYGVAFGVLAGGMGLLAMTIMTLERRHSRRRPGPGLGRDPHGTPATVIARAPWLTSLSVVSVVLFAGPALAAAIAAFVQDDRAAAVLLLLFGAWMASYLVPLLRGQVETGGLYLTPEGIAHRKDATWWRIGWDDIAGVVVKEPLVVVLRDGVQVDRGRTTRWGWQRDARSRQGALGVQTRYLALDAGVIGFLVLAYRDRPDLRDQLGTQTSLDWPILRSDT